MRAGPPLSGVLAASVGGAVGAVLRWLLTLAVPVHAGQFPWTTFAINLSGAALLAAVPLLPVTRRAPWVPVLLGTGVLGGYTTMSTASVETFSLLDGGHVPLGILYAVTSALAAIGAVLLVDRFTTAAVRAGFEAAEGDE